MACAVCDAAPGGSGEPIAGQRLTEGRGAVGRSGLVRELGHVRRCMIEHRVSICDGRGRPAACNVPRRRIALGGNGRRSRTAQHTHDAAENKLTHDAAGVPPFMSGDCTLKASPVPAMASATAADVERRAPMLGTASTQSRQLPFPTVTRPGSKQQGTAHGAWAMAARAKRTHQAATTHAHALASRHQRAVLGGEPHQKWPR